MGRYADLGDVDTSYDKPPTTRRASDRVQAWWSSWIATGVSLGVVLTLAVLAERRGNESHATLDLATGCTMLVCAVVTVRERGYRFLGLLLLAAGASWFLVTADLTGALTEHMKWLHHALLVHAVLITSERASVARGAVIVTSYIGSISQDRALSTTWLTTIAAGTAALLVVDAMTRRSRWRFTVPAVMGMLLWSAAVGIMREHHVLADRDRLVLYGIGLGLIAVSVAASAAGPLSDAKGPTTADIIRDGGPADVRIGFSPTGGAEFEEIDGRPFVPRPGEATAQIELGGDLGAVVIAVPTQALDVSRVERELLGGLRLLAANHLALQITRSRAAEVAASEQRMREAESIAAAQIGVELDRLVVQRIDEAIELVGRHRSDTGSEAWKALHQVRAEVQALASGLSPLALGGGLQAALTSLADHQPVHVEARLDEVRVEPHVARALYFAAAECLTNAVRHAAASTIQLTLTTHGCEAELTVTDDGCGGAHIVPGGGLAGLATRMGSLGGDLTVGAGGEGGTVITVHLPLSVTRS